MPLKILSLAQSQYAAHLPITRFAVSGSATEEDMRLSIAVMTRSTGELAAIISPVLALPMVRHHKWVTT